MIFFSRAARPIRRSRVSAPGSSSATRRHARISVSWPFSTAEPPDAHRSASRRRAISILFRKSVAARQFGGGEEQVELRRGRKDGHAVVRHETAFRRDRRDRGRTDDDVVDQRAVEPAVENVVSRFRNCCASSATSFAWRNERRASPQAQVSCAPLVRMSCGSNALQNFFKPPLVAPERERCGSRGCNSSSPNVFKPACRPLAASVPRRARRRRRLRGRARQVRSRERGARWIVRPNGDAC